MMNALLLLLPPVALVALNRLSCRGKAAHGGGRLVGDAVAAVTALGVQMFFLALTDRTVSSVALTLLLIGCLFAGNCLKVRVLDEPLVFSDVFLAGHAVRFPRLYFGYAPAWVWPVLAAAAGGVLVAVLMEPAMGKSVLSRLLAVLFLPLALMMFAWRVASGRMKWDFGATPLVFSANADARAYTPLGAALLHCVWHGKRRAALRQAFHKERGKARGAALPLPHIVLVQAESWCPVARILGRPSVTPALDAMQAQGAGGAVQLLWRGAYTMRTEFAVLSGLRLDRLETYGFDPYHFAEGVPVGTLCDDLKALGYRTVAWHPNDGRFFARYAVLPNLGFDEFHDAGDLGGLPRHGRYSSDEALLARAAEYLEGSTEPTFLFIVTMECHGPWDAGRFEGAALLSETERYEWHLASLDRGAAKLRDVVASGKLDAVVGFYGDHWPGLRDLRRSDAPPDTPWLLWGKAIQSEKRDLPPEGLRAKVLEAVRKG